MEPVQTGAVPHLEAHTLAPAGWDRVEAGAVLGLGQRQPVEVDRGGLGERVLDQGVEALAAAGEKDRLDDLPGTEVGDVPAAAGDGINTLGHEAAHLGE